jgi:hypothetical protein
MPDEVSVKARVTINAYEVIDRAVEEGLKRGYYRAHKHADNPSEDSLLNEMKTAVMGSLSEILNYDDLA